MIESIACYHRYVTREKTLPNLMEQSLGIIHLAATDMKSNQKPTLGGDGCPNLDPFRILFDPSIQFITSLT